ncbi:MAG: cobalamin-binding protein [Nitrospira sp.]|nr:cobalamin-binding protein [Nitrospira sp.]
MRICSLLPGATEVVAALGLADDLVGISHECDYPPDVRHKPVLVRAAIDAERTVSPEIDRQVRETLHNGRPLYQLDETLFSRTQPDLVITQDLCNVCAVTPGQLQQTLSQLAKEPRLLTLNPMSLEDILTDVERIGAATGRKPQADALVSQLRTRLQTIHERIAAAQERPKVACLEWLDPLYAPGHWVPEMVAWAGGRNLLGRAGVPSEPILWEAVLAAQPDVLILMPCGFSAARTLRELEQIDFQARRPGWSTLPAVRNGRVFAVDSASYFSRPGPRLVEGVAILATLCHPSIFGHDVPTGARRVPFTKPHAS